MCVCWYLSFFGISADPFLPFLFIFLYIYIGMSEMVKERPPNPIEFLASYLLQHDPQRLTDTSGVITGHHLPVNNNNITPSLPQGSR